jgi:hypothetical protein
MRKKIDRQYKEGKINKDEYDKQKRQINKFTYYNSAKHYDGKSIKGMSKKDLQNEYKNMKRNYAKTYHAAKIVNKAAPVISGAAGGIGLALSLNDYNHNLYRAWKDKDPKKRKDVTFKEWKKMGKPKN